MLLAPTATEMTQSRSKMYSVDASRMMSKIQGFQLKQQERFGGEKTFRDGFNDFSYDIGKTDYLHQAVGYITLTIYCLFYIVAASGYAVPILYKEDDEIAYYFFRFFTYMATFCPDTAPPLVQCTVVVQIFILVITQNLFTLYMIRKYQKEDYPSTLLVDLWLIMGRIISPLLSCYTAYAAAHGIFQLISQQDLELGILMTVFGLPALVCQIGLLCTNAIITSSTPLLRRNDPVSLWYAFSYFELTGSALIMGTSILQRILNLLDNRVIAAIIHLVVNTCCGIGCIGFVFIEMPFTRPHVNGFILALFFFTTLLGTSPILALKTKVLGYAIIVFIAIFLISIYLGSLLITLRMKYAVRKFYRYHAEREKEEDEGEGLGMNVLCNFDEPAAEPTIDDYGFVKAGETELAIRIGFLYNIHDAVAVKFLQSAYQAFRSNKLLFAICQVLTAVETDSTLLMTICKQSQYDMRKFMNGAMFLRLVNDLRLERLSPKNQPLMDSFAKAKSATKVLSDDLSDFWTAALKGRTDLMVTYLPVIAVQMTRAENVYEKNVRNFPNTPLLLREIAGYYRASLGDHKKCLVYQSMYHKSKKVDLDTMLTTTTTTLQVDENVDRAFYQKMEPYIAAQDAVMGVKSPTTRLLTAAVVVAFIGYLALLIVVLATASLDLNDFESNFTPVQTITDLIYSVVRLAQLFRRRQLCEVESISPHIESTGPVLGTLNEFITVENIEPAIRKHMEVTRYGAEKLLEYCKRSAYIKSVCEQKSYRKVIGESVVYVTNYELFSSLNTAMMQLVNTTDWAALDSDENLVFLFENFEESYQAISGMIQLLENDLLQVTEQFKLSCYILIAVIWVFPLIALLPMFLFAVPMAKAELKAVCRLICNFPKNELSSLRRFSTKSEVKIGKTMRPESYATSRDETTTQNQTEMHQKVCDSLSVTKRARVGMFSPFFIAFSIFIALGGVVATIGVVLFYFFANQNIDLAVNTFRLYRVSGSCPSSYVFFQELFAQQKVLNWTVDFLKERATYYIGRLILNFDEFVFGDMQFSGEPGIFTSSDVLEHFIASNPVVDIDNDYPPVNGYLHAVYYSESCDSQIRMVHDTARYLLNRTDTTVRYNFRDEFVYHFEHLIFAHLDTLLQNGRLILQVSTSEKLIRERETLTIVFITTVLILIIVYFALVIPEFVSLKRKLFAVRNLILLISPITILKTQSVVKWISGENNKNTRADIGQGAMDQEFLKHIVNNSKCGLILMDNHLNITFYNNFAGLVFRGTEDLTGKNIVDLLEMYLMDPNKQKQIQRMGNEVQNMVSGRNQAMTYEFRSSVLNAQGSNMYILITILGHQESGREGVGAGSFSMVIADRTTEYYQEALVADEKRKGNQLIASMMPPVILQKMHEGEKDISFEVQNATVAFACICDFEDIMWDMDAVEVVQFLNAVYEEYDKELSKYPEITKIRTTGSLYMVASGLFSEFPCADVMVNYCLGCLAAIDRVIEETGVTFQVTMGLNTGGPIRCGVLGRTRPVFDILGDVITIAYRMTATCIPGCIQISEATYEQVKFLRYQLRERGEVSLYGEGTVKGYLVSDAVSTQKKE